MSRGFSDGFLRPKKDSKTQGGIPYFETERYVSPIALKKDDDVEFLNTYLTKARKYSAVTGSFSLSAGVFDLNSYATCALTSEWSITVYSTNAGTSARRAFATKTLESGEPAKFTELVIDAANYYYSQVARLTDTTALLVSFNGGTLYANILTLDPVTGNVTAGTTFTFGSTFSTSIYKLESISSTKVLVLSRNASNYPAVSFFNISGSTVTFASTITLLFSNQHTNANIKLLPNGKLLFSAALYTGSSYLFTLKTFTINGDDTVTLVSTLQVDGSTDTAYCDADLLEKDGTLYIYGMMAYSGTSTTTVSLCTCDGGGTLAKLNTVSITTTYRGLTIIAIDEACLILSFGNEQPIAIDVNPAIQYLNIGSYYVTGSYTYSSAKAVKIGSRKIIQHLYNTNAAPAYIYSISKKVAGKMLSDAANGSRGKVAIYK